MSIIIIGAGHAAAQCVLNLKRDGVETPVTLIGDEAYLPYMRPPLSKAFLQGEQTVEQLLIKPESYYADNNVKLINAHVQSVDKNKKTVSLDNGAELLYTQLIIATGAKLRRLSIEGAELDNICYLKSITDAKAIQARLSKAKTMVVCGGGYIGLEVAASARKAGLHVTVLEMAERIMQRVVSPQTSDYFSRMHSEQGVNIVCNKMLSRFVGENTVQGVCCSDGSEYQADIVVVGIGVQPETRLAEQAGLNIDNGISVNEYCQTSDKDIYAIGDCASHHNAVYGRRLRLECVQNANGQAKTVASHLQGKELPYNEVPWFWSDQYDSKLQIAGLLEGYDNIVVRGDINGTEGYSVMILKNNILIAIEAVKRPKDFMFGKSLIAKKIKLNLDEIKDSSVMLNTLM